MQNIRAIIVFALVVLLPQCTVYSYWQNFDLISITNMNDTDDSPMKLNMTIRRIDRKTFGISGNARNLEVCRYDMDMGLLYSANANGHYVTTPYQVGRQSANDLYNMWYVKVVMNDVATFSDLPQIVDPIPPEVCRLFEHKTFNIVKYNFDPKPVPLYLNVGLYKCVARMLDGDEVVGGTEVVFRLS